ncbi:serine hydrolase domain-containing protein [Pricia sp. S334]|uniref:Serine hydrolase domain-containing protein n=1 Tax=Pricia mediterranea TaxID=3076079 RepID=A0ABU3L3A5_9FLAO|nr:serine hydrolase domain-containing protein [Pricia sp. S334]MDT7828231.1 serine hydrolase domain-containing protein [Pricia sp. S334]
MKKYLNQFLSGLAILVLATSCKSNANTSETTNIVKPETVGISSDSLAAATERLHKHVDEGKLPGTFMRVIKDGEVIYDDKYGHIDVANNTPTQENSLYRIFSMTKPVTATAIMTLYDQGKLSLDDKVSKYIPEFAQTQVYKEVDGKHSTEPQKNEMTIRHLLTHTSGIPYGWEKSYTDSIYATKQFMGQDWTIEEMTKELATVPLKFQPGTKYNYGLGIDVAGYIVEVISGKKLDDYFKSVIFDPLEMDNTAFYVPEEKMDRTALIYTHDEEGKIKTPEKGMTFEVTEPPKLLLGGAGLFSTLGDYEKFCRMLLNKGELNGKRVLSEKAVELIMTDQFPTEVEKQPGMGHGLSGTVRLDTGEYSWGGAAATKFWIDPTNNLIVIGYTQLMGGETDYATEFKATVDRSLMDQ